MQSLWFDLKANHCYATAMKRITQKWKRLKKWQKISVIVILVFGFFWWMLGVPLTKDDGISKFSGEKQDIARAALEPMYHDGSGGTLPYFFYYLRASVEDVRYECSRITTHEVLPKSECETGSNKNYATYWVKVATWTFFGIKVDEYSRDAKGLGI